VGAVHRSEVYFAGMGLKCLTLTRFPVLKKKKKKILLARKAFVDEMIASRVVFVLLGKESNKG
jgi:hypothetical protein